MLKTRLAEESDVTQQQELHCEIRELESLIPDLESKVFVVEPLNSGNIKTLAKVKFPFSEGPSSYDKCQQSLLWCTIKDDAKIYGGTNLTI